MAWNEPGNNGKDGKDGGKDKDSWKQREGRDQSPPDLDEVFKNFKNKTNGFFGKKT